MTLRHRAEIQVLLKKADDARRVSRELEDSVEQLYRRIGRLRGASQDNEPDPRSGRANKASRKK
jgi:hypothetical protein